MQIVVSTRHGEISDRLKDAAEQQFRRLTRYESRISRVEVTFSEEKNRWEVEALASIDRAEPVHAHGEDSDPRTALDAAADFDAADPPADPQAVMQRSTHTS